MPDSTTKTLIIRFSSVGDIVLSSPLIRALRRKEPDGQIDFLVKDAYADLVRHNPNITHVLSFPSDGNAADLLVLRRKIMAERYDRILDIHDSLRSRIVSIGGGDVRRINKRKLARFILVHCKRDFYSFFGGSPGVADRYLETVEDLGIANDDDGLDLFLPPEATAAARHIIDASGIDPHLPFIGVCPSARHFTKMWPPERYAMAASRLAEQFHAGVLLLGAHDERNRCVMIADAIRQSSPAVHTIVAAGRTVLSETAALMDACMLVLTNDTGLMHIAVARKRPVVAVFGSTTRQLGFFPVGRNACVVERPSLNCRPCSHIGRKECPLGHFHCMLDIEPDAVVAAAQHLIARE